MRDNLLIGIAAHMSIEIDNAKESFIEKGRIFVRFPHLDSIKPGDVLVADDGFTCLSAWEKVTVQEDPKEGLYVSCSGGEDDKNESGQTLIADRSCRHYLEGQAGDDDECVGLWSAKTILAMG